MVADAKLVGYLLNGEHPEGAPKAKFLRSFGFDAAEPGRLRQALLAHIASANVTHSRSAAFGIIYEVVGRLGSPDGRDPVVRTVWIIPDDGLAPRFVTLVPDRETTR